MLIWLIDEASGSVWLSMCISITKVWLMATTWCFLLSSGFFHSCVLKKLLWHCVVMVTGYLIFLNI